MKIDRAAFLAACRPYVSGLGDAGRSKVVQCMKDASHCAAGIVACIDLLGQSSSRFCARASVAARFANG